MAAAYAALSSVLLSLDNILELDDDNHPVFASLDRAHLRSLREGATSLRESLQNMPTDARDDYVASLNSRILEVASRIDVFIADNIYETSTPKTWSPLVHRVAFIAAFLCFLSMLGIVFMSGFSLMSIFTVLICVVWIISRPYMLPIFQNLGNLFVRNVTEDHVLKNMLEKIDSLKDEVAKIGKYAVVGMDNDLEEIMQKLTGRGWNSQKLKVIPIVGMGGIGKTTLATHVYEDESIRNHFDICVWATVSQEYRVRQVLIHLLASGNLLTKELQQEKDDAKLGEHLRKKLIGSRFLIVMDDVWDVKIWDEVRRYFPERNEGSRVLLTTQLIDIARSVNFHGHLHQMRLLKEHESRSLLHDRIFGSEDCPEELRDIGDEIVKVCDGLPLALVVIGGLLSKIERTKGKWRSLVDSLEHATEGKDGDKCMKILALSYKHLPRHLRPCFLYMGMFPEDYMVPVNKLIQLWAAEGFLRRNGSRSPEELAEEYLEELVKRNLILASSWCSQGKMKSCKIHDVLRKLCLHEARKKKFLHVIRHQDSVCETEIGSYLRLCVHKHPNILNTKDLYHSRARSLLFMKTNLDCVEQIPQFIYLLYERVRVLDLLTIHFSEFPSQVTKLKNLRYLALTFTGSLDHHIAKLRNLETIVHQDVNSDKNSQLPVEIWMMENLRHLHVPATCLSSPSGETNLTLQTLTEVINMRFGIQVINGMRDLKKLSVSYDLGLQSFGGWEAHELQNLVQLDQMEKLKLLVKNSSASWRTSHPKNLHFPMSLKKLTLSGCRLPWGHLTIVGALPNLEVLKLRDDACQGEEWAPIEEQYGNLKLLELQDLDLIRWRADETHFPCLQRLTVKACHKLEDIPVGIGDIQTLQRIELLDCPRAVTSVETIKQEQDDLRDMRLDITVVGKR